MKMKMKMKTMMVTNNDDDDDDDGDDDDNDGHESGYHDDNNDVDDGNIYYIYIYTMLVCSLCQRKTSSSRRFVLSCFAKPAMRPGTGRSVGDGFAIQWFAHPVGLLCIASKRQCPVGLPV